MDLGLRDKVVLISGSSQGIGYATATAFLNEGSTVILNGRSVSKLNGAIESLNAHFAGHVFGFPADITNEKEVYELVRWIQSKFDHIDIMVANLGSGVPKCDNPLNVDEWRRLFDVNIFGNLGIVDKIHPLFLNGRNSNVIFVSSIVAKQRMNAPAGYAAAKSGVLTLTKYLSELWADDNIRVNCVLPGNIYFKGGRWEELESMDKARVTEYIRSEVPMRRFGKPREVADAILFLASEKASFITGSSLVVDGGQLSAL